MNCELHIATTERGALLGANLKNKTSRAMLCAPVVSPFQYVGFNLRSAFKK